MGLLGNIAGFVGVSSFLIAYYLLQKNKATYDSACYLGLNFAGALLVMASLIVDWNLPAFVLEAAWASISMYGLYKHVYLRRRN